MLHTRVFVPAAWLLIIVGAVAQFGAVREAEGLSPRYYLGTSAEILKRQGAVCLANQHSCLDINATGACCANTKFCVVLNDFTPGCCDVGSNCALPCAVSEYQCKVTTTVRGTATATAGCCARSCSAGSFKCAAALGGQCCPYNSACGSGTCISTAAPSTTAPPVVSLTPGACLDTQFACASSVGGGCCNVGQACTVISSTNYCAQGTVNAIRTGADGTSPTGLSEENKSSGLSSGAKGGIGAGIAVLALLVIGGVLYFCVLQRRKKRMVAEAEESVPAMSQTSGKRTAVSGGAKGRPNPLRQQTAEYFGPDATAGPYTDNSPTGSPGFPRRSSPLNGPSSGNIAVEIDSGERREDKKPDGLQNVAELP